jgi:hypothetical protein
MGRAGPFLKKKYTVSFQLPVSLDGLVLQIRLGNGATSFGLFNSLEFYLRLQDCYFTYLFLLPCTVLTSVKL